MVRAVAFAVSLALAGPAPSSETVGIAWYRKATVDDAAQQRLEDDVRDVLEVGAGGVLPDAVGLARRMVSHEIPIEEIDELADVEGRMKRGNLRFRVGEFDAADAEAELVIDSVRQNPVLPGASSLLWRAHLLRARVAWTRVDDPDARANAPGVKASLRAAVTVDPTARLSTRRVPPDFVAVYDAIAREVRSTAWITPDFGDLGEDDLVEIDGQPGLRKIAPGEHIVVLRRAGHPPVGALFTAGSPVRFPVSSEAIPDLFPADREAAERLCDKLELTQLVLARQREDRVGLEIYRCTEGYSPVWYGFSGDTPADGLPVVAASLEFDGTKSVLPSDDPWPVPEAETPTNLDPIDRPPEVAKKPWYKRAWIWVVVGGVVVAGVTTGAVLGTRPPDQVYTIDGDAFLRR